LLRTCFRLRPAAFFFAASAGAWSRDPVGSGASTPLVLATGSVVTSDDDVIHKPEEDKSMSGFVLAVNVVDAGCRSYSLDWEQTHKVKFFAKERFNVGVISTFQRM